MGINVRELMVRDYEKMFRDVSACVFVDHAGVTAEESKKLRRKMHDKGLQVYVVRNELARLAFRHLGMDTAAQALSGTVTMIYGEDGIAVSKALADWNRSNRPLPVRGAYLQGTKTLLTARDVSTLAKLPDRKTMLAILLGTFVSPIRGIANCFYASLASFVNCVQAHIKKMDETQGAGEADANPPQEAPTAPS